MKNKAIHETSHNGKGKKKNINIYAYYKCREELALYYFVFGVKELPVYVFVFRK